MSDEYLDLYIEDSGEVRTPATNHAATTPPQRWLAVLLGVILVGITVWMLWPRSSGPSPTPIPTDGAAVLFALDGETGLSESQAQVAISQIVQSWCDDNGVLYRRHDVSDDLSRVEPMWQQMMDAAKAGTPPNMVTVDPDGDGRVRDIPSTTEEALEVLKGLVE